MAQEIQPVMDLLSNALRVPIRYYNLVDEDVLRCSLSELLDVLFMEDDVILKQYRTQPKLLPALSCTAFCELYGAVPHHVSGAPMGILILGPVVEGYLSAASICSVARDNGLTEEQQARFQQIHSRLPRMSYHQFLWSVVLAAKLLGQPDIGAADVACLGIPPQILNLPETPPETPAPLHTTLLFERTLLQILKDGDPVRMNRYLQQAQVGNVGVMSPIPLRQHQDEGIICVALASRAAIDAGVHPEIAFSISDIYIQRIEVLEQPTQVHQATLRMLMDFTARVAIVQRRAQYARPTRQALDYIALHLCESLSVEGISRELHVDRSYLSTCFHRDTGRTISQYITGERVLQACSLLERPALSVSDVSAQMGFGSVSRFCAVFREIVGVSPGEYRRQHGVTG